VNALATAATLASGVAVLAQDLFVPGYRAYHRDLVWFVAAYCAVHALMLAEFLRDGPWIPWLVSARAAVAYVFLLNLESLWPQWRYWTPGRYVYQLFDVPGIYNLGLYALLFLGRGLFNSYSLLRFTERWWRPLRQRHPLGGRLVTAALVAALVLPVWAFLTVTSEEARVYSPEAEAVAREVLGGITCETLRERAGQTATDLRRRGERSYHVQIAYDCAVTRVVVRLEDGRVGSSAGSPGDCCRRAG
jgi:hypothetical protein